jgi:hypothetical protein
MTKRELELLFSALDTHIEHIKKEASYSELKELHLLRDKLWDYLEHLQHVEISGPDDNGDAA